MAENNTETLGKKVFFLYPSAFIQNQLVPELAQDEFEIYVVKDAAKLRAILKKYPDSIVFANINEGMKEDAWEEWIRRIMSDSATAKVGIGIIASALDENRERKFVEQLNVSCGCTVLKSDPAVALKQITNILNTANAKGRRKYIRFLIKDMPNVTVNLPINGTFVNGTIKDISVMGFSCSFADDPALVKNSLFADIQIRLQSQLLKTEGINFGSRMDADGKIYVVLFTQRISPDVRTKIRKFVQSNLQARMDQELK